MTELPDSWADEPWPLEDPSPGPALRPTSWSDSLATGIRAVAGALADIDLGELLEQVRSMAEDSKQPAIRFCPRHGPMAKGGWCRRCSR